MTTRLKKHLSVFLTKIKISKKKYTFHDACTKGNIEQICKHLYHGADPTVPNPHGFIPIELLPSTHEHELLLNLLFPYTFDENSSISLHTMTVAMCQNSSFFPRLMTIAKHVTYNDDDIQFFRDNFSGIKAKHLKLFIHRFEHIVENSVDRKLLFYSIIQPAGRVSVGEYAELLDVLLTSRCVHELARTNRKWEYPRPIFCTFGLAPDARSLFAVITQLVEKFGRVYNEEEITKRVILLVSYGLKVTLHDLNTVYNRYGYSELFRVLLHMDIYKDVPSPEYLSFMTHLYHDPLCEWNSGRVYDSLRNNTRSLEVIFDYFNQGELKAFCFKLCQRKEFVERVKMLPKVPSLVELSRNVTRTFIVEKFNVWSSKRFLTILNGLPVDKTTKRILSLEMRIYS